ncbi:class I adenylate-forming enzyme family protein [Pseudonocardia zijingensis]|uniref:class I adenylate-forming enzyme family protein n=1 Tax=Pseudonocardia zijingensis TaxID=153376 RepID=UPI00361BF612
MPRVKCSGPRARVDRSFHASVRSCRQTKRYSRCEEQALDTAYLLRRAAASYPDVTAVDDGVSARSFSALIHRAERLANALDALGVAEGASVGILSDNRTEFVEADCAVALGRRVRVALNARLHLDDFRHVAQDADLRVLLFSRRFADAAHALAAEFGLLAVPFDPDPDFAHSFESLVESAPAEPRRRDGDPEAASWIIYTSGTTGRPKGVVLSHRAIREVALNLLLELGPVRTGERILLTQAISHASGYFVLPYLISGAGVHLMPRFDPDEVWRRSRQECFRTLKAVPAMLEPLLDAADGEWGFETIVYGASSVALPVLDRALDRFGPTLIQDYGQSEAPMTITCLGKDDHLDPDARRSAGRPWRSVAVEVRDEHGAIAAPGEIGEVHVRGSHMMTGYHRNPEATAAVLVDGWLRTKDLALTDERGFVHLQGRSDEMINSGGYNIAPREVENVLSAHAAVSEAVVLGMPDPRWGDAVTAVVRLRGPQSVSSEELIDFVRPRLGIRTPRRLEVWDSIPRTAYGKVDRVELRKQLANGGPS